MGQVMSFQNVVMVRFICLIEDAAEAFLQSGQQTSCCSLQSCCSSYFGISDKVAELIMYSF